MWYEFLPRLLNMSITGGIIILAVMLVRLLLRPAPKIFSYALWAIVLLRLLCPISVSSPVSVLNLLDSPATDSGRMTYVPDDIVHTEYPAVDLPIVGASEFINNALPQGEEQLAADPLEAPVTILTYIWFAGAAVLLLYSVVKLFRLKRALVGSVRVRDNIYLADHITSPCVLGAFRPKIYLPSSLSENEQGYIILHEQTHIRRLDHIVRIFAFLALCVHWFNPLVWVAFILSGKDMEMSCDEAVIKKLGGNIREDYSRSLVSLATGKRIIAGTPLAFGEGNPKSRIKNVLNYKKPAFWIVLLAVIVCAAAAVCLLTNPSDTETSEDLNLQDAQFTLNEDGCVVATVNGEIVQVSAPVPVPAEWAEQDDLAGRNEATALFEPTYFCAGMVSSTEGWLVVSYSRGVGTADTYVYRTADGGLTWTETESPEGTESNYTWLPGQLGFLGADRLLIAYRLFNGTPVFLTKDGGETWEVLEMPQGSAYEVESIQVDGNTVKIALSGDTGCVVSYDQGDTWEFSSDGAPEDSVETLVDSLRYADGTVSFQAPLNMEAGAINVRVYGRAEYDDGFSRSIHDLDDVEILPGETYSVAYDPAYTEWGMEILYREQSCTVDLLSLVENEIYSNTPDGAGSPYGDTARRSSAAATRYDFDHDGAPERLELTLGDSVEPWTLWVIADDGTVLWTEEAFAAHVGWNTIFTCRVDGEDYLLRYQPTMFQGVCSYCYTVFWLKDGEEQPLAEDTVDFDINWGVEEHQFDPAAISAFVDGLNNYLRDSKLIMTTDDAVSGWIDPEAPQEQLGYVFSCSEPIYDFDNAVSLQKNLEILSESRSRISELSE